MFRKLKSYLGVKYYMYKKRNSFKQQLLKFKKDDTSNRFIVSDTDLLPCLGDDTGVTHFDTHYIYHPAWAARIIKHNNTENHIDISSTLHFCSMLSAFISTEFYDYRPAPLNLSNLKSGSADLTNLFFETGSLMSVSCMHTIEHIGLGRYGDPIDPEGDIKAIKELQRVTAKNGNLLLVTPVGKPRIQFNAHRIYSYELIYNLFGDFELRNFSLVTDSGEFIENANPDIVKDQTYGCGCFQFIKK